MTWQFYSPSKGYRRQDESLAGPPPSNQFGAVTGTSWGGSLRSTFGLWGSKVIALSLVSIIMGWYGLAVLFMADTTIAVFHLVFPRTMLCLAMAVGLACNCFFGLLGIAEQSCQKFKSVCRRRFLSVLSVLGAILAAGFSVSGLAISLHVVASLNFIILPIPTVIVLTEWFLHKTICSKEPEYFGLATGNHVGPPRRAALAAFVVSTIGGVLMIGILPGMHVLQILIVSIQTWLMALCVYLPLRLVELRRKNVFYT